MLSSFLPIQSNFRLLEMENHVVESFDAPVLNLQSAPYRNGLIIRDVCKNMNRNDLLNQLVSSLHLQNQSNNLMGVYFIKENFDGEMHSVVLILRNVKKLLTEIKDVLDYQKDLWFIRINGALKEVIELKKSNYTLKYSTDDPKSSCKLLSFDNERDLSLHQAWNILERVITDINNDVISIIVTKKTIYIQCSNENGYPSVLRALLLSHGTDFNLRVSKVILVFVRKSSSIPQSFKMDSNVTVHIKLK